MSPRRRKDRHEASGFSRRPDPDSDEDEDYERERRKRSKGTVCVFDGERGVKDEGGNSQSCFIDSIFLCSQLITILLFLSL